MFLGSCMLRSFSKKKTNRFLRHKECFLRVHNYPLAYRTMYKRPNPEAQLWDERFKKKESAKTYTGVLKRGNFPAWYVDKNQ